MMQLSFKRYWKAVYRQETILSVKFLLRQFNTQLDWPHCMAILITLANHLVGQQRCGSTVHDCHA